MLACLPFISYPQACEFFLCTGDIVYDNLAVHHPPVTKSLTKK